MATIKRPELMLELSPDRPRLVAGVGCTSGAGALEIIALIAECLLAADVGDLCAIGTLDRKAREPSLITAALHFGVPLQVFAAGDLVLSAQGAPGQSATVAAEIGIPALAEAVALKAGTLLVSKRKSTHATCAIGLCSKDFDLNLFGQAQTSLYSSSAAIADSTLATSSAGP